MNQLLVVETSVTQPVVIVISWLTDLLGTVSDRITIEPTLLLNHHEATISCRDISNPTCGYLISWLTNFLATVSNRITIEPTYILNHHEETVSCRVIIYPTCGYCNFFAHQSLGNCK